MKLVHHLHSDFSMLDGLTKIPEMVKTAKAYGYTAISLTDHGTMSGTLEFHRQCLKNEVKPVMGCEFYLASQMANEQVDEGKPKDRCHIVLMAKNETGWQNLLRLMKISYQRFYKVPIINLEDLAPNKEGLICTSACVIGAIAKFLETDVARALYFAHALKNIYGKDFYIEVQPNSLEIQRTANRQLLVIANKLDIPMMLGLDAHYLLKTHALSHETLLGINTRAKVSWPTRDEQRVEDAMVEAEADQMEIEAPVEPDMFHPPSPFVAIGEETPVEEKKVKFPKKQTRMSFGKPDFFLMSPKEVTEFWDTHHKNFWCPGVDEDNGTSHIVNLERLAANNEKIADEVEVYKIEPSAKRLNKVFGFDKFAPGFTKFLSLQTMYDVHGMDEDAWSFHYLRYLVYQGFYKHEIHMKPNANEYVERLNRELIEIKEAGIVDYFLIVHDVIRYCANNGISVGPGRGCLTGDTQVLTENGYVELKDIKIGDRVVSHTGNLRPVYLTHKFEIDEPLLNIKLDYSYQDLKMTKDHKVWGTHRIQTNEYLRTKNPKVKKYEDFIEKCNWIEAKDLAKGDLIFTPYPKREVKQFEDLDFAKYVGADTSWEIKENQIVKTLTLKNGIAQRKICKESKVSRNFLRGYGSLSKNARTEAAVLKVNKYLEQHGTDITSFKQIDNAKIISIKRTIPFDNDFCFMLGFWIGDGWVLDTPKENRYVFGLAFNSEVDAEQIIWFRNYFTKMGFEVRETQSETKKLLQFHIYSKILVKLIKSIFPNYKQTSQSKDMGDLYKLDNEKLRCLITGLIKSDGHVTPAKECIDTASLTLAMQIKQCLLYLGIPSGVVTREPFMRGKYLCNRNYKISFRGFSTGNSRQLITSETGYFSPIRDITEIKGDTVYDISVENDTSYLTAQGAVHNSAAGSLTTYLLDIHQVDSIEHELMWERFYNAGRKGQMPDIDLDINASQRHLVCEYLSEKYGKDNVAHIVNFNKFKPKSTLRAVLSYYEYPYDLINELVGDFKFQEVEDEEDDSEMGQLLEKIKDKPEFSPLYASIERDCYALLDGVKSRGTHASGMVVTNEPLATLCPVITITDKATGGRVEAAAWDKTMLEELGFLKLDILGVKVLDIIDETIRLVKKFHGKTIDISKTPLDDPKVYDIISRGLTAGIFQFNLGTELQGYAKTFGVSDFNDVCALTALGRPGAKQFLGEYMQNRNKTEQQVELPDMRLYDLLKATHYVMVYQEQQLNICKVLAGFDLKQADNLRKIVSKKKLDKLPEMKQKFIDGYVKNTTQAMIHPSAMTSVTETGLESVAEKIWGMYFSECSYLFNKSHAVGYSIQTVRTAWLKTYYITEFMTAALQQEDKKIADYIWECLYLGVQVYPPHYTHSKGGFTMLANRQISFGIYNIKYVSSVFLKKFEENPEKALLDSSNRKIVASLVHAGVYDNWKGLNRKSVYDTIMLYKGMKKKWEDYNEKKEAFDLKVKEAEATGKKVRGKEPVAPELALPQIVLNPVNTDDYILDDKIAQEESLLGFSFSDPDYKYKPYINAKTITGWRQIGALQDNDLCEFFGSVESVENRVTKTGKTMFTIRIKYAKSFARITMFENTAEKFGQMLNTKEKLLFKCKCNIYYNTMKQKSERGFTLVSLKKIQEIIK